MRPLDVPVWKEAPFLRLLIPFIVGIMLQRYIHFPVNLYWTAIFFSILLLFLFTYIPSFFQFKNYWSTGVVINILLGNLGGIVTWHKDIRHDSKWLGYHLHPKMIFIATINEPVSGRNRSYKASASMDYLLVGGEWKKVRGNVIIYFQKDSQAVRLTDRSSIAFSKPLQPVRSIGNPGAFDHRQYSAFRQVYHQVFLEQREYAIVGLGHKNLGKNFLFRAREKVIDIIRKNIPGQKEAGLAEALVIGYKDDLDKGLVQSYSNTGVMHVIAISGLHLGLIYWLLARIIKVSRGIITLRWIKPVLIISGLWGFSLLAGGSASVLRSAVMFTFIVFGENVRRRTSVYNSLASSALLLLCFDPFWLWDIGFQLSYIAVLSILIFMRPVYHLFFIRNKLFDLVWKLSAVTIAAQILVTPISIYYFNQFPNYFLLTNLVAVPLSSGILLGEIALCAFSFIPVLAKFLGNLLGHCIQFMNFFIEHMEEMPLSVSGQLLLSIPELIVIYFAISACGIWLLHKNRRCFIITLVFLCLFASFRSSSLMEVSNQQKLIVYNVPNHSAIDFIHGRHYHFLADQVLRDSFNLQKFYLNPSRILHRLNESGSTQTLEGWTAFCAGDKRILVIKQWIRLDTAIKGSVDIVILSGNPGFYISDLLKVIDFKFLVFDSSTPSWKVNKWKAECKRSGIHFYSVAEKGAFILNLNT